MRTRKSGITRRRFLKGSTAAAGLLIVPRHVLGGSAQKPPSETFGGALIGCGGRGPGTFKAMGLDARRLASCDVKYLDRADFIAEGRAVAEAERRYGRIFQVGTFGRFGASRSKKNIETHKIMASGLLKKCQAVHIKRGGLKVKRWSGHVHEVPMPVPKNLDWNMYCGPSPWKPYYPHRVGGTHRGYWDYEGGGLADMGQHHFDPVQWIFAKDDTSPVEIEAHAPPAHPEACGMWGWVELKYADGLTFVMDSGEWGQPYDRKESRGVSMSDLDEESRKKVEAMPDPQPLVNFAEAVKTRERAGGNADAASRSATILHLANIAIRTGRKIRFDPVKEEIVGDDEANRLVNQPMRAPWHL